MKTLQVLLVILCSITIGFCVGGIYEDYNQQSKTQQNNKTEQSNGSVLLYTSKDGSTIRFKSTPNGIRNIYWTENIYGEIIDLETP